MIDWDAVERAGIAAAMEAIDRGAAQTMARAKELAPYRRVSEEESPRTRLKTMSEIEIDRPVRERLALAPDIRGTSRIVSTLRPPRAPGQTLTRRGRYEVKTMRAQGRHLRDLIYMEPAKRNGSVVVARIVSPAPHSKYQEYGTSSTPAHPYMRPAAHEGREALRADVASSVAAAIRPRMSGRIEATITMKAR